MKERIVIKIGSSTITNFEVGINYAVVDSLARQVSDLRKSDHEIAVVSSGAVAAGRLLLGSSDGNIIDKQVAAIYGQPRMIHSWISAFGRYNTLCGEVVLTGNNLEYPERTLLGALKKGVPVINANDAVNDAEMKNYEIAADNDQLAGFVARTVNADRLILLTDVEGVKNLQGEVIEQITTRSEIEMISVVGKSRVGTGGMASKIDVAWRAAQEDRSVWIASGHDQDILLKIMNGERVGTKIWQA